MSHVLLTIVAAACLPASPLEDKLPRSLDLTAARRLVVQHDGRWPPLDTAARDIVEEVTGNPFYEGHDPVLLLFAWTFAPETWKQQPLFNIKNAELRSELQLPAARTTFSYTELVSHPRIRSLIMGLSQRGRGEKMDPLEAKVSDISSKLVLFQEVTAGEAIRLIPDPRDITGVWGTIGASDQPALATVEDAWDALEDAYVSDDGAAFTAETERLAAALELLPAASRPSPELTATELRYNRLAPFRSAWIAMAIGAVLAAGAMLVRRKWFDALAVVAMIVGFGVLTYGLSMRWQIAGRIPASNMFESLLFLGWGAGGVAIISGFVVSHRLVILTASAVGAVALMLADILPMDSYIRPIVPVLLDTVWMSIHVPVIMVSYAVLALGALVAHTQLVLMAALPSRRRLHDTLDSLHYWYIHVGSILLLAGIVTGSMWAASSWGRYWGWDPKEVWSLVALLGYLGILHVRIDQEKARRWAYVVGVILAIALFIIVVPKLRPLTGGKLLAFGGTAIGMVILVGMRGQFATALKSVVCFWLIIMTYVGVNYVLGIGLHSYGFGTGAVVRYMFRVGGIDLALILVCCVIYLARRRSLQAVASPESLVVSP
jgi:ABC-type transport system involved in cytochrome c biogenesis permease subunit